MTTFSYFNSSTKFIKASKDAKKSAQEERIKAVMAARSLKMSQGNAGSRQFQSSQLQSMQQRQHQQQYQQHQQQQQQQHDPFYSVQVPFQQLQPSLQSTHEKFTPPLPDLPSFNSTPPTSFSSLLQDVRLSTNHYEEDDFDSFEPLNLTSTPKVPVVNVPMESTSTVQELQKELCLLKTQVEILHDEVRHLKKKVKVT